MVNPYLYDIHAMAAMPSRFGRKQGLGPIARESLPPPIVVVPDDRPPQDPYRYPTRVTGTGVVHNTYYNEQIIDLINYGAPVIGGHFSIRGLSGARTAIRFPDEPVTYRSHHDNYHFMADDKYAKKVVEYHQLNRSADIFRHQKFRDLMHSKYFALMTQMEAIAHYGNQEKPLYKRGTSNQAVETIKGLYFLIPRLYLEPLGAFHTRWSRYLDTLHSDVHIAMFPRSNFQ